MRSASSAIGDDECSVDEAVLVIACVSMHIVESALCLQLTDCTCYFVPIYCRQSCQSCSSCSALQRRQDRDMDRACKGLRTTSFQDMVSNII